jgi:hypothetical protein
VALPVAVVLARDAGAQAPTRELGRIVVRNHGGSELRPAAATCGFAAPQGALAPDATIELRLAGQALPSQLDAFNAWPDGSLRFGAISTVLPRLARGAEAIVSVAHSAGIRDAAAGISAAELAAYLEQSGGPPRVDWTDRDHGGFAADAARALRAPQGWNPEGPCLAGRWLSGPICTEWVCSAPLSGAQGQHPSLRVWFHCRAWRDRAGGEIVGARVHVVLDNSLGPRRVETREAVGDVVVSRGGKAAWQRVGRTLPALRWDNPEGTTIKGANYCAVLSADQAVFEADDRFKILDFGGTAAHLLEVRGPREAVGKVFWWPDFIVRLGKLDAQNVLRPNTQYVHLGAAQLQLTRRVRIEAAEKQDIRGRAFTVEGLDPKGRPASERIAVGGDGKGQGRQLFGAVLRIAADGPIEGPLNVGLASLAGTTDPPRLWGMSLAPWTRWPVTVTFGMAADAEPHPDGLIRARVVPHYDPGLKSKQFKSLVDNWTGSLRGQSDSEGRLLPNSRHQVSPAYSLANVVMGGAQAGGRPDLAVVPGQHVLWLMQPDGPTRTIMLTSGEAFNQWPWQFRDRATGLCVDPAREPGFSLHPNADHRVKPPHLSQRVNSICQMGTDPEHWMEFNYVPFLVTGDLVHYEALYQSAFSAWAWHPPAWPDAKSGGLDRAIVTINARAIAWVIRNFGHVRACGPDRLYDPLVTASREIPDRIYARQQLWLKRWYVDGPEYRTGLMPEQRGSHPFVTDTGAPLYAYAQWMHCYLTAVTAQLNELGALDANGRAFFDWHKNYTVDQVDPTLTHPATAATFAYWRARRADGTPFRSLGEVYRHMADVEWPEPSSHLFTMLSPYAKFLLEGDRARISATVKATIQPISVGGRNGVVAREMVGRQVYSLPDKGLGTILAVADQGGGRGNRIEIRIERPFGQDSYEQGKWRLQLPAAGPAQHLALDATREVGDYPYLVMGALGLLANAGVPKAKQAWEMMRGMARNSGLDFPDARADFCAWAISPREQR